MNFLSSIITYVRRIVKTPSDALLSDNLIIDYINRFYINDVDARIQLFDLKSKYQFQTAPGYDRYNMPVYQIQTEPGPQQISYYPVYQGFLGPSFINGIQVPFETQENQFYNIWPNVVTQQQVVAVGNGGSSYNFTFPVAPNNTTPINPPIQYILRGHVDMAGVIVNASTTGNLQDPIIANTINTAIPTTSIFPAVYLTSQAADGSSVVVCDSGQFLTGNTEYGLLMSPGKAPTGNTALSGGYSPTLNTFNYYTGTGQVTFPKAIPQGVNISAQCYLFKTGLPRGLLFFNNYITLRTPPDRQYLVEMEAYLTPAAFLNRANPVQFGYMSDYIGRGAARVLLSDVGDWDQFNAYEPMFKEQEMLVWKRSQRQFTATRTQTIYSQGINQGQSGFNSLGSVSS